MSEHSTRVTIQRSSFMEPYAFRCPLCAALLLNEADEKVHAEWHLRLVTRDPEPERVWPRTVWIGDLEWYS